MQQDELILTVAIFAHGCENLLDPFRESHPEIGEFYKNNVRVFSQSCVPDIPSVTSNYEHISKAKEIRSNMQSSPPNSDTFSILEPYISACKPQYMARFQDEKMKTMHPEYDLRLFESQYNDRSCGMMVYLANKTFYFYDTSPTEQSRYLHGIVLLDVRLKKTFEDGHIEYERIFTAPRNDNPIVLTTYDGLLFLFKTVLRKPKAEYNQYMTSLGISNKNPILKETDLIKLFELFKLFQFINILDYTCRTCRSDSRLSPHQIEEIYEAEQDFASRLPKFGGNRKTRNRKTRNRKTRNRKTRNRKTRNRKTRNRKTRNRKTRKTKKPKKTKK
jgi:hypothetical protein